MSMYSKEEIFLAISNVIDPEVGFNLVEMGLIYDAACNDEGDVYILMTLSTKACPMHQLIEQWVVESVKNLPNTRDVDVELVWEPAWNVTMADDNVQIALEGN